MDAFDIEWILKDWSSNVSHASMFFVPLRHDHPRMLLMKVIHWMRAFYRPSTQYV